MARIIKPAIYIFCEGESEIQYATFLKTKFQDVVAIQKPIKGTFDKAESNFKSSSKYRDNASEIDEIWFFFDLDEEQGDQQKWDKRLKIIKNLRKLRKKPNIQVRLLMTTGCVEYWFSLHFAKSSPQIKTSVDKINVEKNLKKFVSSYEKGDKDSIYIIAENYKTAIENGKWSLQQLQLDSSPKDEKEEDIVNEWLYKNSKTFSNVHEAIVFLEQLRN